MRTFCPHCQTTFRITPEQLKARAGKVRCGQCQTVFNALDCLLEESGQSSRQTAATPPVKPVTPPPAVVMEVAPPAEQNSNQAFPPTPLLDFPTQFPRDWAEDSEPAPESSSYSPTMTEWPTLPSDEEFPPELASPAFQPSDEVQEHSPSLYSGEERIEPKFDNIAEADEINAADERMPDGGTASESSSESSSEPERNSRNAKDILLDYSISEVADADPPISERRLHELGETSELILPRNTTEISGYSRWAEDVVSSPMALPDEKPTRWPFVLVALLLILLLTGQVIFHFRSEIAITAPSLRPFLQLFSETLNSDLPLPRHVERVSIEASDLQTDRTRNNLLLLTATVRNRARYEQAYPSLELSLTDTGDTPIVRRVFSPADYLPETVLANQPFAASSDVAVRLWIEAKEITAAGYRLYVFYP